MFLLLMSRPLVDLSGEHRIQLHKLIQFRRQVVSRVSLHVFGQADALDTVDRDLLKHVGAHASLEDYDVLLRQLSAAVVN